MTAAPFAARWHHGGGSGAHDHGLGLRRHPLQRRHGRDTVRA
jgi:hypothetical protein